MTSRRQVLAHGAVLLLAGSLGMGCGGAAARSGEGGPTLAGGALGTQGDEDGERGAKRGRRRFRVGQVLRGRASYYSDRLAGRPTASGEPYDPRKLTAASRDLPLGTRVRVTRVDTGDSVVVRVNDRGPFGDRRRILDLSRAAAERLHMIRRGVVRVRARILELPPPRRRGKRHHRRRRHRH